MIARHREKRELSIVLRATCCVQRRSYITLLLNGWFVVQGIRGTCWCSYLKSFATETAPSSFLFITLATASSKSS